MNACLGLPFIFNATILHSLTMVSSHNPKLSSLFFSSLFFSSLLFSSLLFSSLLFSSLLFSSLLLSHLFTYLKYICYALTIDVFSLSLFLSHLLALASHEAKLHYIKAVIETLSLQEKHLLDMLISLFIQLLAHCSHNHMSDEILVYAFAPFVVDGPWLCYKQAVPVKLAEAFVI